jgi:polyisoprenoid-binding protein YceI
MKRIVTSLSLLLALTLSGGAFAETFKLDPAHSWLVFKIRHLDLASAWGLISAPTGSVTIDDADASKNSVQIEAKIDTILTGNAQRDTHLKNPDFFDAKQFPTIGFKSTSVKKTADNTYEVAGDFTMHGVTKPLTVTLKKTGEGDKGRQFGYRAGFETTFTIKRSDYGMTGMTNVVGDEVTIMASIEGTK